MADLAARLADFAVALSPASVPTVVRRAAMRCILDVVGVTLAGSQTELAGRVRDHAGRAHGAGPCRVLGSAATASALGAALANGAAAHVLDYDDTCYAGIVHGSAAVFPAVLAAGETAGIGGAELLAAFIAGCEVEFALGRRIGDGIFRWWTSALLGTIGAAAGAARALQLDKRQTAEALRIAACGAFGLRAVFGSPAKPYLLGRAAQAGLDAALAASAGIAGPAAVFEGSAGFFARFADHRPGIGALTGLGERFGLLDPGIAFKLHPVCSAAQAAIDATAAMMDEHGITSDEVEHVGCEVTPFVAGCLAHSRPRTIAEAQFSMTFAVGCILAFGRLDLDCLDVARLDDPRLAGTLGKIAMVESAALAAAAELRPAELEAATVTLTLANGRRLTRHVAQAIGMPGNPASDAQLDAKFRTCATRTLTAGRADALLQRILDIEALPTLRPLFD